MPLPKRRLDQIADEAPPSSSPAPPDEVVPPEPKYTDEEGDKIAAHRDQLKEENDRLNPENDRLKQQLKDLQAQHDNQTQARGDAEAQLRDTQTKHADATRQAQKAQDDKDRELAKALATIEQLRANINLLSEKLDNANGRANRFQLMLEAQGQAVTSAAKILHDEMARSIAGKV